MFNLLLNDLRIDIDILKQLDYETLYVLCDNYRSTNMKYLKKVLGDINEKHYRTSGLQICSCEIESIVDNRIQRKNIKNGVL